VKLAPEAVSFGMSLGVFDAIGSTNDEALDYVRHGFAAIHWVVARQQNAGRGRHGRVWASPVGNLYASLALSNPCEPRYAPQLGFVAGLALHQAITDVTGVTADRLTIKWPNDLMLDRAKVSGLLVEGSFGPGGSYAVIGMGVNCLSHPTDTPYDATDLAAKGAAATPDMVFEQLSKRMAEALSLWDKGAQFALIRKAWLARAAGRGERISVRTGESAREGLFRDIDEDGRLVLEGAEGLETVLAGDVFFLPPQSRGLSA
jgi:BirA family biotin operon repressor/biotin-[acetyl-CoA-carboxylase] ligase